MFNIAYITDDGYVLPTKASINSIVKNITDEEIFIHVVALDVSRENRESLLSLGSENVKIEIRDCPNTYKGKTHHLYVSSAMLCKFDLPAIFTDLDRLLYVDGDTLLNKEFIKIFQTDISDYFAAVCKDPVCFFKSELITVNKEHYFNSGVLYLNLKKLRDENSQKRFYEEFRNRNAGDDPLPDQTIFNCVFGSNILLLNPKFNLLAYYSPKFVKTKIPESNPLKVLGDFYGISESEMDDAISHPAIIHLAGSQKAWNTVNACYTDEWFSYAPVEDKHIILKRYCTDLSNSLKSANNLISRQGEVISRQGEVIRRQDLRIRELNNSLSDTRKNISEIRGISFIGIYIEIRAKIKKLFRKS